MIVSIFRSQKTIDSIERKKVFFVCFLTVFPPFYAKRSNRSRRSSIFSKDRRDRTDRFQDKIDLLITKNNRFDGEKYEIFVCFWQFSPLFMPKDRIAPVHLRFFLKIDTIDSLSSIFRSVDHKKDWFDWKTDYRIPNTEIFKKQCTTWGCPWGGWGGPSWGCRRPWPAQRSAAGQNIIVRL